MADLTEEKELRIRTALTEKAAAVESVLAPISEPMFFEGKQDFAAQVGVIKSELTDAQNAALYENLLADFCMVSLVNYEDDPRKGCADSPVVFLTYEFLVFQEFKRGREKDTGAHNRLVGTVLKMRNEFLRSQTLSEEGEPRIRHFALRQIGRLTNNQATQFLPGVNGFYATLQTRVEVS